MSQPNQKKKKNKNKGNNPPQNNNNPAKKANPPQNAAQKKLADAVYRPMRDPMRVGAGYIHESSAAAKLTEWQGDFMFFKENKPLNSPFREMVLCQKQSATFQLNLDKYRDSDGYICCMFQPDLDFMFAMRRIGQNSAPTKDGTETVKISADVGQDESELAFLSGNRIWFDHPITMTGDADGLCIVQDWPGQTGSHWSNADERFKPGAKRFNVGGVVFPDEKPTLRYENETTVGLTVIWQFLGIAADETILFSKQCSGAVARGDVIDLTFTDADWTDIQGAGGGCKYIALNATAVKTDPASRMEIKENTKFSLTFNRPWVFTGPVSWDYFNAFDLIGLSSAVDQVALRAQYGLASHVRVPIVAVTIKNATTYIAKGGLVSGCQVPGKTSVDILGLAPRQLFDFTATRRTRTSGVMEFVQGFYAHSVPEKIQDWMFRPVVGDPAITRSWSDGTPKVITVIKTNDAAGTQPMISFTVQMHYEFLTVDKSCPLMKCPGDAINQLKALLFALHTLCQFWENPTHLDQLRKMMKSVVKSPIFRKIALDMIATGAEVFLA